MKKVIKISIIILFFICIAISFKKYFIKDYSMNLKDNNLEVDLRYRGLKKAVDFAMDDEENCYIAYKSKIQFIDNKGKSYNVFSDKNMNINSMEYYKGKLYFSSYNSVYSYDIQKKKREEIISGLPNFGDHKNSLVKVNGDYLYITIGSATNSGVVGLDNSWVKNHPFSHDISPYKITLRGINFDEGKTGAFVNYGTRNIDGQIIPGHFPGNASVIMYNLQNGAAGTYVWGIRNVNGIDFDSKGRMIASIGGMENRGLRAVKGDTDYIYVLKYKNWYGWPDYSGGDPISSPRFKDGNNRNIPFILDNHPTTNPEAPLYTHKNLGTLKSLAVDKSGLLGDVDSIYFYDDSERMIYSLNNKGVLSKKVEFNSNSKISSIKYAKNQILILDSNLGNMYNLKLDKTEKISMKNRPIIYFLLISTIIIIIAILKYTIEESNKKRK